MSKNPKYSSLDVNQMKIYSFDEDNDAQRVVLVGGEGMTFNFDKVEMKMPEVLKEISIVKELEIKEIEKQVIVTQDRVVTVEVPKIIEKCVYKEISVPVVTKEIQIVEVPKYIDRVEYKEITIPVIQSKIEVIEKLPVYYKILMAAMSIVTLGSILIHVK